MPMRPPRSCACGRRVPAGTSCACQKAQGAARKARHDRKRPSSSARGYTSRWERERLAFLKANPFCKRCGEPATVVDHVRPHKGDAALFWDRTNWQPLCAHDHNAAKQREERRASGGCLQ